MQMIMPWDKAYDRKSEEAKREKEHIRNQLIGKASNDTGHLMEKMILWEVKVTVLYGHRKSIE